MKQLNELKWKAFNLCDIFSISAGVRLTKSDMIEGARPFIGATDSNPSLDKNVLGVNYNGSVVENFYHPYECIFSDDVKRLHLLHHEDNKYVLPLVSLNFC